MSRIIGIMLLVFYAPFTAYAQDLDSQLIEAVKRGQTGKVQALLAKGADVNAKDKNDSTALILAAQQCQTEVVTALLGAGADAGHRNKEGWTALMFASWECRGDRAKVLVDARTKSRASASQQTTKLIHRVNPEYPKKAKEAGIQGLLHLLIVVDESGNVAKVKVIRGHPLLNEAAVDAVKKWKYSPTLEDGKPVPVFATVTINFQLK